ncbi:MAG: Ig-like domain-containing protein, partial [Methanomassiliicoccales archaeon]
MRNATGNFTYGWVSVPHNASAYWITNFTNGELLKAGSWSLKLEATDGAGNVGTYWSNFIVTPFVTFTTPSGNFINRTNFTFTWTPSLIDGTSLVGYKVSLYNETSDSWLGDSKTVTVPEIWLHNITGGSDLFNGASYTVYVNVTDSNSNYYNASLTFTVDASVPSVFWVKPQNNTLWNDNNLAIQWYADGGSSPIVKSIVTLTNSTGWPETLTIIGVTNSTTLSAIWGSNVPDDNYTLKVVVYDAADNYAQAWTNFTIDATFPAITIISPVDESYTNKNNFTASWTINDARSGTVYSWARVINTTGAAGSWVNITGKNSQWITNFTNKQLLNDEGAWAFIIAARDAAGNNATAIANFTIDKTAPTAVIIVPGAFINLSNFTASWNGDGTGSPIDFYRVRVQNSTGASAGWINMGTVTSAWITNFTAGKALLTEGSWTMDLYVQDKAGNNATVNHAFVVDLTNPIVTITFPAEDGDGVASRDVNVTWTGSDALSGIDHYNVSIDGNWIVLGDVEYNLFQNLSEGVHTLEVVAFDKAGNTQTATRTFIVDVTKPTVQINFPAGGQVFKVNAINVTWVMADDNLAYAEIRVDSSAYISVGTNTWYEISGLSEGAHIFSVKVYDIAGNWNETNVSFFVDTQSPVVVITNPVDGGYYNDSELEAQWLGFDPTPSSNIAYYWTQLDSEGWVNMSLATTRQLNLTEGVHTLEVQAFDNAGNSFLTLVTFTIDLTKPTVEIIAPTSGDMFASQSVLVEWSGSDNLSGIAHYEVSIDGGSWILVGLDTNYTFTGLADGNHTA